MNQTQTVLNALYDLPLGGSWRDLQTALCAFWEASGEHPDPAEIRELERHFDRAMAFLERLPHDENRWRHELFRIPVPACVLDRAGNIIEANAAGQRHLGNHRDAVCILSAEGRAQIAHSLRNLKAGALTNSSVVAATGQVLQMFVSRMPAQLQAGGNLFLAVMVTRELPAHGQDLLTQQFDLTTAEAELCFRLAAGNSLDDVARKSEQKKTTLRTHLANSFAKLGVNSQPALVSLVLHSVFAASHLEPGASTESRLTPHLNPEIHGHPRFIRHQLTDGRYIGCLEYGDRDGIPAFYLHGSLGSGLFMRSQKLHGNGVRLLAVERGGVGETSPNPDPHPDAYAQDILALADHLGVGEFAVIGRSMGSWDAVSLVLAAPARARLLLLAGGRLPVQRAAQHQNGAFYTSLYHSIWHSDVMGRLMLRMMLLRLLAVGPDHFLTRDHPMGIEGRLTQDPLYARHMMANWLRSAEGGTDPVHSHLKLYRDPVAHPPWLNLSTPTILMHGLGDQVVPHERIIEQTASFRNRTVVLLPDVGHRLVQLAMGEVLRRVHAAWQDAC